MSAENKTLALLRWAGSKRQSLPSLKAHLPGTIDTYIEPFAGAACLAFSITSRRPILGDLNSSLIEFYTALRDKPAELHRWYSSWDRNPETYSRIRAEFNAGGPPVQRAAQFLYLNKHCFNGLYRVNASGAFNVPWGGDKAGAPLSLEKIQAASARIDGTTLVCGDFEEVIEQGLGEGAFVYLNPPYARREARVFREYDRDGFGPGDWDRLIAMLERIDRAGARFLLSYAADDEILERLSKWSVGHLDLTRNIGGAKTSRHKHREFIATNYDFARGATR